jgi:purine-binding chemotaxis protein CheW
MDTNIEVRNKIISYLTFKLGDEIFAANVSKVLNILELTKITKVPMAPPYMKGVINLRGDVLPVVDVRLKFGMEETQFTTSTCILVLIIQIEDQTIHLGALVDSVQEVLEIEDKEILPPPSIGSSYNSQFITGVVEYEENFIMILDVERVFTGEELQELKETDNAELQGPEATSSVEIEELKPTDKAVPQKAKKEQKSSYK